jgi:hypothetical protein
MKQLHGFTKGDSVRVFGQHVLLVLVFNRN